MRFYNILAGKRTNDPYSSNPLSSHLLPGIILLDARI